MPILSSYRYLSHSCVFIALERAVPLMSEVCELLKEEYSKGPIDVWDVKVVT